MEDRQDCGGAKPSILLHSCCGPCSSSVSERLAADYAPTVFFYNPNITERGEHERRREAQLRFIDAFNAKARAEGAGQLGYVEPPYEPEEFFRAVAGLEGEAEGGARCGACFRLRLDKSAEFAAKGGYGAFATTLSVSPHKDFQTIKAVGQDVARGRGAFFLAEDFKKKDGFRRSLELSRQHGLYRQDYCGCPFSRQR